MGGVSSPKRGRRAPARCGCWICKGAWLAQIRPAPPSITIRRDELSVRAHEGADPAQTARTTAPSPRPVQSRRHSSIWW